MGRQRLEEALTWVNAAFSEAPGDVRNWPRLDPLAEHAWAAVLHADAAGIAEPTARLMGALDVLFQAKAQYRRAEQMSRAALSIVERTKGEMAPELATRLNNLAQLLQATNRLGEAEPLMRRALAIDEASYGAAHPDVAIRLNNLAQLLQATNRLGEAEPPMRRHVIIFLRFERDTGHPHPHRDAALNNYTRLLQRMGKSAAEIAAEVQAIRRDAGLV